jgi:dihydrofolate reductase
MSARGQVIADISMSLDGYVAAPGVDLENGMGVNGEVLHTWAISSTSPADKELLETTAARSGAVIMGRRTFDIIDGPKGWNEDMGYGAAVNATPPVFVMTHSPPEQWRLGDRFMFVTDGLRSAVDKARAAAGDKDVVIMGGGAVVHAFLAAGLVDVLQLHVAPVILGGGTPLFPAGEAPAIHLEFAGAVSTAAAQHLTYHVCDKG